MYECVPVKKLKRIENKFFPIFYPLGVPMPTPLRGYISGQGVKFKNRLDGATCIVISYKPLPNMPQLLQWCELQGGVLRFSLPPHLMIRRRLQIVCLSDSELIPCIVPLTPTEDSARLYERMTAGPHAIHPNDVPTDIRRNARDAPNGRRQSPQG